MQGVARNTTIDEDNDDIPLNAAYNKDFDGASSDRGSVEDDIDRNKNNWDYTLIHLQNQKQLEELRRNSIW